MTDTKSIHFFRRLRETFVIVSLLAFTAFACASTDNVPHPASPSIAPTSPGADKNPRTAVKSKAISSPTWAELNPAQQRALAPLAADWDKLESFRKKKWLEIGNKFAAMTPDEQARIQERMREWAKLTPEQRRVARDSYARTKKLNREQKSAKWEQYQHLPEEQKKKLAADAAAKKPVANLPATRSNEKMTGQANVPPKTMVEPSLMEQPAPPSSPQPAAK